MIFANICKGFGMNVLAYDKFPAKESAFTYVELDSLFKNSDIISLHCPLNDETKHMINSNAIEKIIITSHQAFLIEEGKNILNGQTHIKKIKLQWQ